MLSYREWKGQNRDTPPAKKNQGGGFDPQNPEQRKTFNKFDLITLPPEVKGTNCWNCRSISVKDEAKKIGFCTNPDILAWVTDRNCCADWDHDKAIRNFEH